MIASYRMEQLMYQSRSCVQSSRIDLAVIDSKARVDSNKEWLLGPPATGLLRAEHSELNR